MDYGQEAKDWKFIQRQSINILNIFCQSVLMKNYEPNYHKEFVIEF